MTNQDAAPFAPVHPSKRPDSERYAAPALDKGLDVIELLATQTAGLNQIEIARRLGRTVNEIFRVLTTLERRGFIIRDSRTDGYRLSMRTYELAHRHPPTEQLLEVALPIMRDIAQKVMQSVHLAVRVDERVLVIAQVSAPTAIGLTVRLGAEFSVVGTTSGQVMLAFEPEEVRRDVLARLQARKGKISEQAMRISEAGFAAIRARGGLVEPSAGVQAVVNSSYPILSLHQVALAALTMPYLYQAENTVDFETASRCLAEAANAISLAIGGLGNVGAAAIPAQPEGDAEP